MSKATVVIALCVFGGLQLSGCKSDDDDSDPGIATGTGGMMNSVGSGGGVAPLGGSGGVTAVGSGGSGGSAGNAMSGTGGDALSGSGGAGSGVAGTGTAGVGAGMPTFTRVWSEVLEKKSCNSAFCHGMAQGNLSMRNKDDAYMNLVDKPAAGPKCGTSGMLRVKPSDPTQSLLLNKISNAMPVCGDAMPIGTKFPPNCLSNMPEVCNSEQETTLVRDWIAAGAMND